MQDDHPIVVRADEALGMQLALQPQPAVASVEQVHYRKNQSYS